MPLVLGVDSSTQSTKVEVRDADTGALRRDAVARRIRRRRRRAASRIRRVVGRAATRAAADAGARDVDAVAVAGQQHGMVVLDDDDEVVRPAKLWNDTESAPDARVAASSSSASADGVGGARAARCRSPRSRSRSCRGCTGPSPTRGRALARVCLPHDWLTCEAVGRVRDRPRRRVGHGLLLAPRERRYRARPARDRRRRRRLGGAAAARARPPTRAGTTTEFGATRSSAPGTGDNMAAALGVGAAAGRRRVSLGTSGTVFAVSETPTADAIGRGRGLRRRDRPLPPARVHAERDEGHRRDRAAARRRPRAARRARARGADRGAGGDRRSCPYFDGERTPNRPDATGTIAGLRSDVDARAARARRVRGRRVRSARRPRRAAARRRRHRRPPRARRRRRPLGARTGASLADLAGRPVVVPDARRARRRRRVRAGGGRAARRASRRDRRRVGTRRRRGRRARGRRPRRGTSARTRRRRTGSVERVPATRRRTGSADAMDFADSILDLVGNTPLVRLRAPERGRRRCTCDAARQGRDREPGRQREGPRRDRDDRRGRARRAAAAGRHDRRADVGQHRRRSRDRRRAARLPLHLRDERQDERREGRAAALVRRRGRRVPDRGAARGSALVLLDRRAARARDAGRVPPRPVLEPGEPARARADDRARDLAADRRPRHALRRRHRHRRHDHRRRRAYLKAQNPDVQIVGADPSGSVYSGGTGPPVPRRGRRRGLLADDLRPVARRPRRRGQRRRLVPHRAARHARRGPADRRFGRHRGARRARGRARRSDPTTSSSCCCPTPAAATSRRSSTTSGCSTWASCAPTARSPATCSRRRAGDLPDLVLDHCPTSRCATRSR